MASIQDWFEFVQKLPNYAPFISVCIKTVDIPINLAIPIPQFVILPELELPDLSQLLEGLPEPPSLPTGPTRQKLELRIPVPSLGSSDNAPSLELDPSKLLDSLLSTAFSALSAGLGEKLPKIQMPDIPLPEIPDDIFDLFSFELTECPETPNEKIATPIPGEDTKATKKLDATSAFAALSQQSTNTGVNSGAQGQIDIRVELSSIPSLLRDTITERVTVATKNTELNTLGFPVYIEAQQQAQNISLTLDSEKESEEEHDHEH